MKINFLVKITFDILYASNRKRGTDMQMTEAEYKELMAHFYFLGDKIDPVYKQETEKVIERLEEEYRQYVKK